MNLHKFKQRKKNNIKTVELDLMKMTDSSENYQAFFISGDDKLTIIINYYCFMSSMCLSNCNCTQEIAKAREA